MVRKLRIAVAGLVLVLAGCSAFLGGTRALPERYMLPSSKSPIVTAGQRYPVVLRVAPVSAPVWLSTSRMLYQLEYEQQGRFAAYTQSRWAEPPAGMVGQALEQTLAASGLFKAVADTGSVSPGLVLQVSLDDFSQRFSDPQRSYGVLSARTTLVQTATDRVLDQREFHYRIPATSANAVGGVRALGIANDQFDADVKQWIQHTLAQCAPGCLTTGKH